ncbi:hypothetical protein [Flintibacter muris]|uniref:hypothetical protein n=1 Tax=Flintibacter muris TaxID=2941327 RepID=UPI00203D0746|nr:hypothetical protein [Flintibacter muris]
MGGLIVVVLWPMILPIAVLYFFQVAMPLIAPILLVWNLIVLAVLLLIRRVWKKSGTMDRSYIDRHSGWKWWLLILLRYGLLVFILWEILLVLFCGAYTIDSPHN